MHDRKLPAFSATMLFMLATFAAATGAQQLPPAMEMTIVPTLAQLQALVTRQPCAIPAARPATQRSSVPDTIRITTQSGYPCTIAAALTGVELRSSDDGSRPDPQWTSVARDGRGRYYTVARRSPVILSYNANGSFNAVLGREGRGPGELAGTGNLYVGSGDTLFAFQSGRVTLFGPNMAHVRDVPMQGITARRHTTHVSDDGRVISGSGTPARGSAAPSRVYVIGNDGVAERGMGAPDGSPGVREGRTESAVAYSGGSTFWTAVASPQRNGYVLEEWALSGDLRRVIVRTASWAASDANDATVVPGGFPYVRSLSVDPDGLVWALFLVKEPGVGSLAGVRITDETESRYFDVRYEAIDPRSGTVLVSGLMSELYGESEAAMPPLPFFLPRTHLTYKVAADSATGLERIQIFEMRAVRRF